MVRARAPILALVVVTAIWGYTFVPVQKAVAVYPLFAFLAVRFAISSAALAPFAWRSLRALPRAGWAAGLGAGALLAADLVDEAQLFQSPQAVGADGIDALDADAKTALARQLRPAGSEAVGPDRLDSYQRG